MSKISAAASLMGQRRWEATGDDPHEIGRRGGIAARDKSGRPYGKNVLEVRRMLDTHPDITPQTIVQTLEVSLSYAYHLLRRARAIPAT